MNQNTVDSYKKLNWNSLLRKDLGDTGNLEEAKVLFDRIKTFFDRLVDNPVTDSLSPQAQNEIDQRLLNFLTFVNGTVLMYSDVAQKTQIIEQVRNYEFEIITTLSKYTSYLDSIGITEDKDLDEKVQQLREKELKINETIESIERLSEQAKKVAQREETKLFGSSFNEQATAHGKAAFINSIFMYLASAATIILAYSLLSSKSYEFSLEKELSSWGSFLKFLDEQNVILYIIVFSILSFLISHFSRNYSSEKNLENIYRQKQKALDSHDQILKSIQSTQSDNDLMTQNAILAYVAKAIFETKETGYLKGVHHNTNPSGPIFDIKK